jgi:Putative Actinobacterial Holin-X, holin superfamily III
MAEHKPGLRRAAKEVSRRARSVAQLQVQLALLEIKQKLAKIGIGVGLGIGAGVMLLYAIGFLFAAAAAGLALTVPLWAALLIVGGALLLITALLAFLAVRLLRAGAPPVPDAAIEEARLTTEALKSHAG